MQTKQNVLITGACGDIGRSLAFEFARKGARLALCDLKSADDAAPFLRELEKITSKVFYQSVDVRDAAAVENFTKTAAEKSGGIDICIANAGIVERGALLDLSIEAWHKTLDVNLTGCFLTAQASARAMIRENRGGQIIFISSWVQDVPRENIGAYCASKGGLKMLAKTFALELGPKNIRVNLVAPGFVDAGLTGQNLQKNPERRSQIEKEIPLGKLISADELAKTVSLLCSDDAAYLTGATLLVDGGSSLFFRKP
jgi:NAD(P)-dependent dehydrogenase (short-subunit alcohol dehydrogenase family)